MLVSVSTHLWRDILVVYTFWAMMNEKIYLESRSSYGLASFILGVNIKPKSMMLAEWDGAGMLHFVRGFQTGFFSVLRARYPTSREEHSSSSMASAAFSVLSLHP